MHDDIVADGLALRIVGVQRLVDVVVPVEMLRQRHRVGAGLGHSKAHVRPRIRCRIADHRDATVGDCGRREIVDRREERLLDLHKGVKQRRR